MTKRKRPVLAGVHEANGDAGSRLAELVIARALKEDRLVMAMIITPQGFEMLINHDMDPAVAHLLDQLALAYRAQMEGH